MDFYYRRLMGHGAVASKFRLNVLAEPAHVLHEPENGETHHSSNCVRCYKLKKKCSRTYPQCLYCEKSGAPCEYVERRSKKRRPEDVHEEKGDQVEFRNIDVTPPLLTRKIVLLAVGTHTERALSDEYLVVRPVEDEDLPLAWAHTYFANYEHKYPFLSQDDQVDRLRKVHFASEAMVNLDMYLVLAVGCTLYDANNGTAHYLQCFSDRLVELIVDVLSYDVRLPEDVGTAHVLLLLCLYALTRANGNLVWNLVGFMDRLILFMMDFQGGLPCFSEKCFWTVHNLDKELSLVMGKPSHFVPAPLISVEPPAEPLTAQAVKLHQLQDRVLALKVGLLKALEATLTEVSRELELWRVATLHAVHNEYADSTQLQSMVGLVNIDYYYLLVELDQLSPTELFQFTLQFLSNLFSLLLGDSGDKKRVGVLLYHMFWFSKFFNVVEYNLRLLRRVLRYDDPRSSVNDFNGNLQLILNLLKFLQNSAASPKRYTEKLAQRLLQLTKLSSVLVGYDGKTDLNEHIGAILAP